MLRCTRKVLALLAHPTPLVEPTSADDWYAHLVWIQRRKCLMLVHTDTLFSVFTTDVSVAQLRPIGTYAVQAIHTALTDEGLPTNTLGDYHPNQVAIGKTLDRRMLGTMNDLIATAEHITATSGGLDRCNNRELNHQLHRTINSITGYTPPIELVTAKLAPR